VGVYSASYARLRNSPPLSRLLRAPAARRACELLARTLRRPHAAVRQRRDGAVQEGLPRHGGGAGRKAARHHGPEVRARGRQAQRPRAGRSHCSAPHLLRDARQLLVRRLLQARRDPLRLGAAHREGRAGDRSRAAARLRALQRRRGLRALAGDRRPAARADLSTRGQGQLLADGRHRSLRAVHGDLRGPREDREGFSLSRRRDGRVDRSDSVRVLARRLRGRRRSGALSRDLESRVHAVRPAAGRRPEAAAQALRGYGGGARAHRRGQAGGHEQLLHRPVRSDHRESGDDDDDRVSRKVVARPLRGRIQQPRPSSAEAVERGEEQPHRRRSRGVPRHRGSRAGRRVPARGWRPSVQRGTWVRPASHPAARGALCLPARPGGAHTRRGRRDRHRHDGGGLPRARAAPRAHPPDDACRRGELPRDDRGRHRPLRSARARAHYPRLDRIARHHQRRGCLPAV
jgi:hypothetical protein